MVDRREFREAYELMERRLRDRLLREGVIHQLNGLAHGYSASVSVLLDALAAGDLVASDGIGELLRFMDRSSGSMKKLLLAIMDIGELDHSRPSSLFKAAQEACGLFEVSLFSTGISVDIAVDKALFLDAPFSLAALCIANVIGNAKDAMPEGGSIRIEAGTEGATVFCRVVDQGRGVPPDIRDRVFDPGFTTKARQGASHSGVGLSLTRELLQEAGARIELTEASDKGSTFTIYFPRAK
jgi:signal transduction histidine kinase